VEVEDEKSRSRKLPVLEKSRWRKSTDLREVLECNDFRKSIDHGEHGPNVYLAVDSLEGRHKSGGLL
jgi:hypothetical protein